MPVPCHKQYSQPQPYIQLSSYFLVLTIGWKQITLSRKVWSIYYLEAKAVWFNCFCFRFRFQPKRSQVSASASAVASMQRTSMSSKQWWNSRSGSGSADSGPFWLEAEAEAEAEAVKSDCFRFQVLYWPHCSLRMLSIFSTSNWNQKVWAQLDIWPKLILKSSSQPNPNPIQPGTSSFQSQILFFC